MPSRLTTDIGLQLEAAREHKRPLHLQIMRAVEKDLAGTVSAVLRRVHQLRIPGMTVAMSSEGGDTAAGKELYNLFRAYEGLRLTMHAVGDVNSAAVDPFLAADPSRRFACANTTFFVHASSEDARYTTARQARNLVRSLDVDDDATAEIIAAHTNLKREDIRRALHQGEELFFNAREAKAAGFVSAIKPYKVPRNAEVLLLEDQDDA